MAFLLIFSGSRFFAQTVVGDERIELPLKILSVSLPCVALSFALSGYFTATGKVYKNSLVQIAEQMIKIFGAVFLLGRLETINCEKACICLVAANSAAEIVSFLMLFLVYRIDIYGENCKTSTDLTKRVMRYGLPVAASAYLRSALTTAENTMIPKMLEKFSGLKETALASYGVVHGMVMPLVFLPSGVVGAVATLLVPEITMLNKLKNYKKIDNIIERTLSLTLMFSVGAAGIMYFFAEEICSIFYKSSEAAYFLKMIAPVVAAMYADGVVDAVLKGLNQEIYAMRYDIVLSAVSILLITTLIPQKGVDGYIAIIYISEMINSYLSMNRLMEVSDFSVKPFAWTAIPAIAVVVSCMFAKSIADNTSSVVCAMVVYAVIMTVYRGKSHTLQKDRFMVKYKG